MELLKTLYFRYRKASKAANLTELVENARSQRYNRKYAVRPLNSPAGSDFNSSRYWRRVFYEQRTRCTVAYKYV
jgi:hypothetical protein